MTWARKRKLQYMSIVALFFLIILAGIIVHIISAPVSCFDARKNGQETGVDCGGSCILYCPNELSSPKVRWVRSFTITPGIVHAVAYVEHGYPGATSREAAYQFKLYDQAHALLAERSGTTYIGPMGRTAIVETLISVGAPVASTEFSFTEPVSWEKSSNEFSKVVIKTDRSYIEPYSGGTRLSVTLENQSRFTFRNMDVIAILYDANDNAITASSMVLPELRGQSNKTVYFTWPSKINPDDIRSIELLPRFNIYESVEL